MKKSVLVLRPHLGIPFKKSGFKVNDETNLPPIRQHWSNFYDKLIDWLRPRTDLKVIQEPLWAFNPRLINNINPDYVFIPHKTKKQMPRYRREMGEFRINEQIENARPLYVMQQVFPDLFTIDPEGWGSISRYYRESFVHEANGFDPWMNIETHDQGFRELWKRIENRQSKFEQPDENLSKNYDGSTLYLCQLPHDESIRDHSDVNVPDAVRSMCEWFMEYGDTPYLVFKGHPINRAAMEPLKQIVMHYRNQFPRIVWVDNVNIHSCFQRARRVVTVNSGAGFEALLYRKPVFNFGKADYHYGAHKIDGMQIYDIKEAFEAQHGDLSLEKRVNALCNWYTDLAYSSNDEKTFDKLEGELKLVTT